MAFSETNRLRLLISKETAWGEAPVAAAMDTLRVTGESLGHNKKTVVSATIRSDRSRAFLAEVGASTEGGIDFEYSHGGLDKLLEGLFNSTWVGTAPRVLKNGITKSSYLIEKGFIDIGQFVQFTGNRVASMSLNIQSGQLVTGSFSFQGKSAIAATATISSSVVAASDADFLNATANVGTLTEGGVSLATALKGIQFTVNNNLRQLEAVAHKYPVGINTGFIDVTGTIDAYFSDKALYEKFLLHTSSSLSFELTDADSNVITWTFPKIYFTTGNPVASGGDQDVMVNLGFTAIFDPTEACTVKLEMNP